MPNDFLDNYLVFLEDFANFLVNQGWDYNTKENIFANIFKHICTKNDLNTNEIKIVGAQAFCRIYYEFFKNLDDMQFNYFDLKKRLELLEKYFQDVNFEIDNYSQLDIEKTTYILTKHKNKLFNKISSFMQMLEQILSSALDLYDDSGYLFSKKLNQDIALKAIYFTPDFLKGQSLLKIVRDFGVLDYL